MKWTGFIATSIVLSLLCSSVYAAEKDDTIQEIEALKARLELLEQRLDEQDKQLKISEVKIKKYEAKSQETVKHLAQKEKEEWKFYGDARIRSIKQDGDDSFHFQQRVRLNIEKDFGENYTFRMRSILMNENTMGNSGSYTTANERGRFSSDEGKDTVNKIDNAYVQINKIGGMSTSLKIGRFGHNFGTTGYWASRGSYGMYDGLEVETKLHKMTLSAGFGDWGGAKAHVHDRLSVAANGKTTIVPGSDRKKTTTNKLEKNYFFKIGYAPTQATNLQLWHIQEIRTKYSPEDYNVTGIGFKHKFGSDFTLAADYSRNTALPGDPSGTVAVLTYKDAVYEKPHTYELSLYYINVDRYNIASPLTKSINIPTNDSRGIGFSASYVLAKNIRADFLTEFAMRAKSNGESLGNYYRFQVSTKF